MKARAKEAIAMICLFALGAIATPWALAQATKDAKPGAKAEMPGEIPRKAQAPKKAPAKAAEPKEAPVKPAGPRLNMDQPARKAAGEDVDLRHCLGMATPTEVIKCAEKKK